MLNASTLKLFLFILDETLYLEIKYFTWQSCKVNESVKNDRIMLLESTYGTSKI